MPIIKWFGLTVLSCMAMTGPVAAADGNLLFKCVDPAGAVSIQSSPCAKGSLEAWRRDATAEPPPSPEQQAQAEAKRQRDLQTVRELSEQVDRRLAAKAEAAREAAREAEAEKKTKPPADAPDRCAQARDFAAQVRDKQWLALSEDQANRLFVWVSEQCKPESDSN